MRVYLLGGTTTRYSPGVDRRSFHEAMRARAGPPTVAGMASTKGWASLVAPGIMISTLGYSLGTFAGIGLGQGVLRNLP